jgi:hypothetical protein
VNSAVFVSALATEKTDIFLVEKFYDIPYNCHYFNCSSIKEPGRLMKPKWKNKL